MPKYLLAVSYTADGAKGVLKDGGTKRREAARAAVQSVGGSLEGMYFAFGDWDAIVIADMPDQASVIAASLALNASGAVTSRTTVLLTPEDIDLPFEAHAHALNGSFKERLEKLERELVLSALEQAHGNQAQAARSLGLPYHQFRYYYGKHVGS